MWRVCTSLHRMSHLAEKLKSNIVADKIRRDCSVQSCQPKYLNLRRYEGYTEDGTSRMRGKKSKNRK